jgi:adenine-specific DNA-methyltransferase
VDLETRRQRKERGAYYTDERVVDFLVRWALSGKADTVMDPSCGDGRFLAAAARLGARRLVGIDVDDTALQQTGKGLQEHGARTRLLKGDFFLVPPSENGPIDAAVGNPPFIRYQRFEEASRRAALESALRAGVRLTRLTSTWAPFLLHAMQCLRPGGAMAFVVPAEIVQTHYGLSTLRAICANFATVSLITFERNFFDGAQTETYLLLTDGYRGSCASIELHPLGHIAELDAIAWSRISPGSNAVHVPAHDDSRFAEAFLTDHERRAWRRVQALAPVARLGEIGTVTNGYVSGANDFFLRTREDAVSSGIPDDWLRPTVRNAASLQGLSFSADDIDSLEAQGRPHHLLTPPDTGLFVDNREALHRLIGEGEAGGIDQRFKCRVRQPWWRVPGIHVPDLFLPYMVGSAPVSSINRARATYTNTLHGLRITGDVNPDAVAVALHATLTLLSMELEGRSYGGGVLKLEPKEMSRVRIAVPPLSRRDFGSVDRLLRAGRYADAVQAADDLVLRKLLGLDAATIAALQAARERLAARRQQRTRIRAR